MKNHKPLQNYAARLKLLCVRFALSIVILFSFTSLCQAQNWRWFEEADLRGQIVFHWTNELSLHRLEQLSFPAHLPTTDERMRNNYRRQGTAFHQLFPQFKTRGSFFAWPHPTAIRANAEELWARGFEKHPGRLIAIQFITSRPIRYLLLESDFESKHNHQVPEDLVDSADVVIHRSYEGDPKRIALQEMVILNPEVIAQYTANPHSLTRLFDFYRFKYFQNHWADFKSSVSPSEFNPASYVGEVFAAFDAAETPMGENFPQSFAAEWNTTPFLEAEDFTRLDEAHRLITEKSYGYYSFPNRHCLRVLREEIFSKSQGL
jgi:hypothetical protein